VITVNKISEIINFVLWNLKLLIVHFIVNKQSIAFDWQLKS